MNLLDPRARFTLRRMCSLATEQRQKAWAQTPDATELKERAIQARDRILADLPGYLAQLETVVRAHGVTVNRADNVQQANQIIVQTLRELNATAPVHNHHPLLDEIMVDQAARANLLPLTPLHPGDHLAQLAETHSGHPIWPVGHLAVEQISQTLESKWRIPRTFDPDHLASNVRLPLRRKLFQADAAILGVHFATVDEGMFVMLDNDGHHASITAMVPHLILLLSIDQMVADMVDLEILIRVFSLSAWGRPLPVFLTYLQKPAPSNTPGPRSIHLILIDHFRSAIIEEGFQEALRCIHCGACHTVCPVYQQIGHAGYAYAPYTGPFGTLINPILLKPELGQHQAFLCDGSNLCQDACPLDIDFQKLQQSHRRRLAQTASIHKERRFYALWQRLITAPSLFRPFWRNATKHDSSPK